MLCLSVCVAVCAFTCLSGVLEDVHVCAYAFGCVVAYAVACVYVWV